MTVRNTNHGCFLLVQQRVHIKESIQRNKGIELNYIINISLPCITVKVETYIFFNVLKGDKLR